MRKRYPSDITREQFKEISPLLESARKRTRPRKLDLYDVFCVVLYLYRERLSMENAATGFPQVDEHICLFSNMERKEGR